MYTTSFIRLYGLRAFSVIIIDLGQFFFFFLVGNTTKAWEKTRTLEMVISSLNRVAPQNISRHHFQKNLNPSTYILLTPPTIDSSTFWRLKKRRKNFFDKSQKTQSIKKRNKKRRRRNQLCVFQFISLSSSFTILGNNMHKRKFSFFFTYLQTPFIVCPEFFSLLCDLWVEMARCIWNCDKFGMKQVTDAGKKLKKNTLLLLFLFFYRFDADRHCIWRINDVRLQPLHYPFI